MTQRPDPDLERFYAALRQWAERPSQTPADQAADRLTARLPARRRSAWQRLTNRLAPFWQPVRGLRPAFAGLAAAALLVALGLTLRQSARVEPGGAPHPLPTAEVVVIPLDASTNLYLTLTPPAVAHATAAKEDPS